MKNEYKRTSTTVSMLNYHFVFCPRYRRKIFLIDGLESRFKESVYQICRQNQIEVLAMECHIDHVHLFLSTLPKYSPADIMRIVKGNTSRILLQEFSDVLKSLTVWTRSYFVSTAGNVSSATIQRYVEEQKTR
jgi:putative transposase